MESLLRLESCHSTWVFDLEGMRFRRILKGLEVGHKPVVTGWRPYFGLGVEDGSDAVVVLLNAAGTTSVRSWRHGDGVCRNCGESSTAEISLTELVRLGAHHHGATAVVA